MDLLGKVKKTICEFDLIKPSEKVLVACSGGKDSTTVLYALKQLGYKTEAITIDASIGDYTKQNIENLKRFCKEQKIKLHIISFRKEFGYSLCYIKSLLEKKGIKLNSCTICGVLRRYLLNKYARKLKADKLATGHNLDDEAQAVVMNMLKNNLELLARQGPVSGINTDKKFVPRIKPLYFVREKEIIDFSKKMKFPVNYEHCPCRKGVYRCLIDEELTRFEKRFSKTHEHIICWLLKILPELKKRFKSGKEQNYCKDCGEPCQKERCMACKILKKIK